MEQPEENKYCPHCNHMLATWDNNNCWYCGYFVPPDTTSVINNTIASRLDAIEEELRNIMNKLKMIERRQQNGMDIL